MDFIMISGSILTFIVSFLLQGLFLIIMSHWITRLIPFLMLTLLTIGNVLSYLSDRNDFIAHYQNGFDGLMSSSNLFYSKAVIILFGVSVIGCAAAIAVYWTTE